jgi:hypothetical protein
MCKDHSASQLDVLCPLCVSVTSILVGSYLIDAGQGIVKDATRDMLSRNLKRSIGDLSQCPIRAYERKSARPQEDCDLALCSDEPAF